MATTITENTLVRVLQSKTPQFAINPDWIDSKGDVGFPIINDLGRYICQQAY